MSSVTPRLRVILTLTALLAGLGVIAARYVSFIEVDMNFVDYASPEAGRFGDGCYGGIGPAVDDDSFDALAVRELPMAAFPIPYKLKVPGFTVPAGHFLLVRCPLDLALLRDASFAWLELGPLHGPTAVYLNGIKRLEQSDGHRAGFPLRTDDLEANASLVIVSKGHLDRPGQPGPSNAAFEPFVTTSRSDLDRLDTYRTSSDRFALFHMGYALALLLVFGVVWLHGMRYADVSWMIVVSGVLALRSLTLSGPSDFRSLVDVQAFHVVHTVLSFALAGFVTAFFRFQSRWAIAELAFTLACIGAALFFFLGGDELWRATLGFEMVVPLALGALLLGIAGSFGLTCARKAPPGRRRRIVHMAVIALISSALYANSAIVYLTRSWSVAAAFDLYLPYLVTSVFACYLAYDLVIQHKSYLEEKASRLAAERDAARFETMVRTTQMIAHDVRRPFSLVRSGIAMLHRASDEAGMRDVLGRLEPEVERAIVAVQGMLADVMEIDSPVPPRSEPIALVPFLTQACADACTAYGVADSTLTIDWLFEHRHRILADPLKLSRVVTNVLLNALQATSSQGRLWVRTSQLVAERVELTLGNDGPMIPLEDQSRLFEAFYTKGKKGGTGLGLAIAKKVVEAHGGTIRFSSNREGTEFVLSLPAATELDEVQMTSVPAPHAPAASSGPRLSAKMAPTPALAIVEDNPFLREAWQECLDGVMVTTLSNPEELLAAFERDPQWASQLSCLVTDQNFEDADSRMKGTELASILRERYTWPVFLSSESRPEELEASSIDGFLGKEPVSWEELSAVIARHAVRVP